MLYNHVTDTLRNWCHEMTRHYWAVYQQDVENSGQTLRYFPYLVTEELSYKLGTLIDKEYPCFEAYRKAVLDLLPLHISHTLKKKLGKVESYYVQRTEAAFRDFMDSVSPDCPAPEMAYHRVIWGEEADSIISRYREIWEYNNQYWYPLNRMSGADKLFLSLQRLEPYLADIQQLLGLPQQHIYEYGESMYDRPHCAEVDKLGCYEGRELACCPKDFSWIIYFSHENTVTFAGTIVPQIKEILRAESEYWNRWEWA